MRGGRNPIRVDNINIEACGSQVFKLNLDGINIYGKTMITFEAGQIFVSREELKVRSIWHCAILREDTMHLGTEAHLSAHVLDINGKKAPLKELLDLGAIMSVLPIKTWRQMGFDKEDLLDS